MFPGKITWGPNLGKPENLPGIFTWSMFPGKITWGPNLGKPENLPGASLPHS